MSLIEFIEKLQKKPRHVRIQILWLSVFISMFIVVSLWVVSLKGLVDDKSPEETKSDEIIESLNEVKKEIPSLVNTFKAGINSLFEDDMEVTPQDNEPEINSPAFKTYSDKEIKPSKLPLSKNLND